MAKWVKYSAVGTAAVVGFLDLDKVSLVNPAASEGTWILRVTIEPNNYTIATGTGELADAVRAFENFLAGDNLPNGA